ncbi:MAG: hypothetical protein P4L69_13405 [Desulfosporosinus sp.]|nr:hypothetical protein [Desulfosporosinus sp.]
MKSEYLLLGGAVVLVVAVIGGAAWYSSTHTPPLPPVLPLDISDLVGKKFYLHDIHNDYWVVKSPHYVDNSTALGFSKTESGRLLFTVAKSPLADQYILKLFSTDEYVNSTGPGGFIVSTSVSPAMVEKDENSIIERSAFSLVSQQDGSVLLETYNNVAVGMDATMGFLSEKGVPAVSFGVVFK